MLGKSCLFFYYFIKNWGGGGGLEHPKPLSMPLSIILRHLRLPCKKSMNHFKNVNVPFYKNYGTIFKDISTILSSKEQLQSWIKYFEQTSILKKSLFFSLPLSNNVENVDKIHAGLVQLQHC